MRIPSKHQHIEHQSKVYSYGARATWRCFTCVLFGDVILPFCSGKTSLSLLVVEQAEIQQVEGFVSPTPTPQNIMIERSVPIELYSTADVKSFA